MNKQIIKGELSAVLKSLISILNIILKYGRWPAIILLIVIITNGALAPISTLVWQDIIDVSINEFKIGGSITAVLPLIILYIVILLIYNLREFMEQIIKIKLTHRLRDHLLPVISSKLLNLEYKCFEDRETHDLITRVGNKPENQFVQFFWELLFIPSYLIAIIGYSILIAHGGKWLLPLVFILAIPALLLALKDSTESHNLSRKQTIDERKVGYLSSLITSRHLVKEIRVFGINNHLNQRWHGLKKRLVEEKLYLDIRQQKRAIFIEIASLVLVFGSIAGFGISLIKGNISYGQFIALCGAIESIVYIVTWQIPYQVSNIKRISMYGQEYIQFMNLPEVEQVNNLVKKESIEDSVEFHDVHFKYPNTDKEVLKGVSFRLNKGDTLAIVGKNGAGKSTIIKLVLGLYKPDLGRITIDGIDLNKIDNVSRRKLFSVVFQDFVKYSLTLRENIGLGRVNNLNDDEEIIIALQQGMAEEVIQQLPYGLDTYLGKVYEKGSDISEGQWQRVAISRSTISNAGVLILDEPTSALDPVAETELYQNFAENVSDRTTILISHRLGSTKIADRILVIDDGKGVEEGTHEELMSRRGLYYAMFEAQSEWYRGEDIA